ncbi:hypothetical protein [Chthonobacter rhizosphaerae]|uniref:hypothetical protein n=1 Tax=Chthonobacter rhizosphaerae TaxID=2735553 RepID=UPI0015EECAE8|nr:hypothetical protein [Chthonobacter rhizosphaerae]
MLTHTFMTTFVAACAVSGAAYSGELKALHGKSVMLGTVTGSTYYTAEPGGYQMVTTLSSGDDQLPVRFVTTLVKGQRLTIAVPGAVGEPETTMTIERIGDQVFISDTGQKTAALEN